MRFAALWLCGLALAAVTSVMAAAGASADAPAAPEVLLLRLDGGIGPAAADHVRRGLQRAEREAAALVVLQMDTPGGLDGAMREIIKAILASPVPVAGFVAPPGARAASAGTYILYACHVAAMAPATNLGAATPVAIGMPGAAPPDEAPASPASAASAPAKPPGDAMTAKRVHDAVAYIRGLALLRGRNADWAERAVREAVSLSATEALAQRVVDLVADDVPALLRQLDGRTVKVASAGGAPPRELTLATAHARIVAVEPGWREKLLATISDPSVALVLMTLGVWGLLFEFANPGFVLPGVVGGVCLLLGLYGLQTLPINTAGLGLLALGIAFLVAEAFLPSFGVLGLGGIVAFAFGALLLVDSDVPGFGIPPALVAALALVSAVFVIGVVGMAARARRRPLANRRLIGATGTLLEADGDAGWAEIQGERWRVRGRALAAGRRVRVKRLDGLTLEVEAENAEG